MASQEIPLKASPSLLYQNLTYGAGKLVYVHKDEPHVLNPSTKETLSLVVKDKSPVHQAKVCDVAGSNTLVLAVTGSTQFWDLSKEKVMYSVAHGDDGKDSFLTRGIASLAGKYVLVGHSTGTISVIEATAASGSLVKSLKEHKECITDIASGELCGEPVFVSADIAGEVIVWDKNFTSRVKCDKSKGDTATCIAVTPTHIVCGYGSGKIRFFTPAGKKAVEIDAHSRWINALAYCAKSNTVATAAEDTLLQLWKAPSAADPKIALKSHKVLKDSLLAGVTFTDDGKVACTAYDTEKLFLFDM